MSKEKRLSGVDTSMKDKDGKAIFVNSYIKDAEGRVYYVNGHLQAVPDGEEDAPAVELSKLLETSEVTVISAFDLLNTKPEVRRRRGRKARQAADPDPGPVAEEHKENALEPVSLEMILPIIPDNVLAAELRRRGYTLCAVKPALINL